MATEAAPRILAAALVGMLAVGCGGAQEASVEADPAADAAQHLRRGLELAEAHEFEAALTELRAADRLDPTATSALAVAHGLFVNGKYREAVTGYRALLERDWPLRDAARAEIEAEITRVEEALGSDLAPVGRSLASTWLRGELARMRAVDSVAQEHWDEAVSGFEKAHEYLGDPELIFEAALAATKDEQWSTARAKLEAYLAAGGEGMPSERQFVVEAEIDRLSVIIAGEEPVTWKSLADQIYAERAGEAEPMELPPSAVEPTVPAEPDAGVETETEIAAKEPELPGGDDLAAAAAAESEAVDAAQDAAEAKAAKKAALKAKKAAEKAKKAALKAKKAAQKEKAKALKAKQAAEKEQAQAEAAAAKAQQAADQATAEAAAAVQEAEQVKAEAEVAKLAATMASEEAAHATAAPGGEYQQVPVQPTAGGQPQAAPYETKPTSIEDLLFFSGSKSSSVRLRAVRGLVAQPDDRARQALEKRMRVDTNMRVRIAAIEGLVARGSLRSIPALREAVLTAATSQERAVLKRAIADLIESTRF
jgi:flagellar biosynthesis GTPase FlhF